MKLLIILFKNEKIDRKDLIEPLINYLKEHLNFQVEQIEIDFPQVEKRDNQYLAQSFIEKIAFQRKKTENDFALALTEKDLFMPELNFVFGLAAPQQKTAIISIQRLKSEDTTLFLERTIKEAVHELGHLLGLEHCPNPKCVMHFSNSLKDTDIKGKEYCDKCRRVIFQ